MANTKDRMKTVLINGVPYRMRADMKLPNYRRGVASNDAFQKGHLGYLTTPASCEAKRKKEGDDPEYLELTGMKYDAGVPEQPAKAPEADRPRMKTVMVKGVPYVMRADMHLPNYRKEMASNDPLTAKGDGYCRHLTEF